MSSWVHVASLTQPLRLEAKEPSGAADLLRCAVEGEDVLSLSMMTSAREDFSVAAAMEGIVHALAVVFSYSGVSVFLFSPF